MNILKELTAALAIDETKFKNDTLPYLDKQVDVSRPKVKLQIKGAVSKYTYNLGVLEDYRKPYAYTSFYLIDPNHKLNNYVLLTVALSEGLSLNAYRVSAIQLSNIASIRADKLGYPIYQYLVKLLKRIEGDLIQSPPARQIWVKLSRDGNTTIFDKLTRKPVRKNVVLTNILDHQVWYHENDDEIREQGLPRHIAQNYFLVCNKITKFDSRLKIL